MSDKLERGAVVKVRLDPTEGSEIHRTRAAVVVSNDVACRFDAVVQVVPLTRLPERGLRPYESRIDSAESGLAKPSRLVIRGFYVAEIPDFEGAALHPR